MIKALKISATLSTLALLAACSGGSGDVVLTPAGNTQTGSAATKYTQIERLSRPAIKEVFETFVNHQVSNATEPYDKTNDPLYASILNTTNALRPPNATAGTNYGQVAQSILYPDEYTVDLSTSSNGPVGSSYGYFLSQELASATGSAAAFGGRAPNDDVIALELGILFGKTAQAIGVKEDNEENNCLDTQNLSSTAFNGTATTAGFPYLATAH